MPLCRHLASCLLAIPFAAAGLAQTVTPSHGPTKGYLLITGGATQAPDFTRFIEMAGGKENARIVVIPTASVVHPETQSQLQQEYCVDPKSGFAGTQCTVLHTTDRATANTLAFTAPLTSATGVWLVGGRHWRLTDAYLNTRTLTELFALLDRGGTIGGGSAGATVQGSFMVRGSADPDDNTIMMAPAHEIGFGFFTNVTIDQHVDARHRENDLAPVMATYPTLLGLGLDQSTSMTIHGDTLTANGPHRIAVWDHKDHNGKPFYYLLRGDTLNTATWTPTFAPHP
jgi:cyanophycinase